jgi:hypothetical protein
MESDLTKNIEAETFDQAEGTESVAAGGVSEQRGNRLAKKIALIIIAFLAIAAIAWGVMRYGNPDSEQLVASGDTPIVQEESEAEVVRLLENVSRHMLLPEEGLPMVATVTHAESLIAEQPFYSGVKNGDKLIIFEQSRKAIIYSPTRDIIVNVGPIQLPETQL